MRKKPHPLGKQKSANKKVSKVFEKKEKLANSVGELIESLRAAGFSEEVIAPLVKFKADLDNIEAPPGVDKEDVDDDDDEKDEKE